MKKHDLPAMPWYWGDWFKCPEVRALSPEARCLWFEMLGLMWESTERGYLTLNGVPMDVQTLARCLGFACDLLDRLLQEMRRFGVYSVRADGAIYNRRMVRDAEISRIRAVAGKVGGICSSKSRSKIQANRQASTEYENEIENAVALGECEGGKKSRMTRPSVEDVAAYCRSRGNSVDAARFVDFYESKGWLVGKTPMKSWQAAVRTWERNQSQQQKPARAGYHRILKDGEPVNE